MDSSAGIVLLRMVHNEPHILCLRVYGRYDLPKGHVELKETDLEAALRETSEETGIDDVTFPWGCLSFQIIKKGKKKKRVVFFLGSTLKTEISIPRNPVTGKFEHHGWAWLTLDQARTQLYDYLQPVVGWVQECVQHHIISSNVSSNL